MERINTYEKFLEMEGLPVVREYGIPDLMEVSLKPWARKGGSGAYINLIGGEENLNAYLCEIPPGGTLLPQRHLYEETIYIMSGCGATTVWVEGGVKQTFEWQEGSLFSPPLNTWHQHFNGQSDKPVRYLGVTRMPVFMNLFHDLDFIFNNNFIFKKRYSGEEGYFSSQGKQFDDVVFGDPKVAETNFVPDCRSYGLADEKAGGMGEISFAFFEMSNNIMTVHISQQRAGTYKTAHHHGPGRPDLFLQHLGLGERPQIRIQAAHVAVPVIDKAIQRHGRARDHFSHDLTSLSISAVMRRSGDFPEPS